MKRSDPHPSSLKPQALLFGFASASDYRIPRPKKTPRLAQWNTVEQVAAYYQVDEAQVLAWVDSGELEAFRLKAKGEKVKGSEPSAFGLQPSAYDIRIARQSMRMMTHRNRTTRPTKDGINAARARNARAIAAIKAAVVGAGLAPPQEGGASPAPTLPEKGAACRAPTKRELHTIASAIWRAVAEILNAEEK